MANIDLKIFVALPDRIRLSPNTCNFAELTGALEREAEVANSITIVGGYFGTGFLFKLCSFVPKRPGWRTNFPLRIAVGIAPDVAQARAWQELRELKTKLAKAGFKRAEIKAIHGTPHVHTKLFLFMRGTQPSYYVGSFNPSDGGRHEMMVRVARKHDALAEYARSALNAATDVSDPVPNDLSTLRGFFMSGAIAFRPVAPQLLTFDAFRFSPAERAMLDAGGGRRIGVRHASPRTEGYGFRLASAFERASLQAADGGDGGVTKRLRSRNSSVETVLRFWVPGPYAEELRAAVEDEQERRKGAFICFGKQLAAPGGGGRASEAFKDYRNDMYALIRNRGLKTHPLPDCEANFAKFLAARTRILDNPDRCARLARVLVLTPTPNLWGDEKSASDFEKSFFEDLAYRLPAPSRRGRILRSLIAALPKGVDRSDPDELREALVERLAERPWSDVEWLSLDPATAPPMPPRPAPSFPASARSS